LLYDIHKREFKLNKKRNKIIFLIVIIIAFLSLCIWYLSKLNFEVLNPKGTIALQERNLIYFALLLSLFVIVPVFTMLIFFGYKYRENNPKKVEYKPDWDKNGLLEFSWWFFPAVLITILGVIAWQTSHSLNPFRPIDSKIQPVRVDVISLQWRWLFIYPAFNTASINYLALPVNTPIDFHLTSDAPMNSFWIPQLSGQIYTMPGMATQLHIVATSDGNYRGLSANISGTGFSRMSFVAAVRSKLGFLDLMHQMSQSSHKLDYVSFLSLAKPSLNTKVQYFSDVNPAIYDQLIMSYMNTHQQNLSPKKIAVKPKSNLMMRMS